ncbi:branched-chain amino acid transaminase [Caldiplasma sukawensis]
MTEERKFWLNGSFIKESEAKVPILTHSLQYGSGIFEGIRSYETIKGAAIFRLREHIKRFFATAKIYSMEIKHSQEELIEACINLVKVNNLKTSYIRPFAFYDDSRIGVGVGGKKVSTFIAAVPFDKYFSKWEGLSCKVAAWRRIDSSVLPIQAKASGNYLNSVIAMNEAREAGFDEAILLDRNGFVAEGPGENIFLVKDGEVITPGRDSPILLGITRDSLIKIFEDMGYKVRERFVRREELYIADEVFFAGTAAEVTPIINIDGIKIGDGQPGETTKKIRDMYFNIVKGKDNRYSNWLTEVY